MALYVYQACWLENFANLQLNMRRIEVFKKARRTEIKAAALNDWIDWLIVLGLTALWDSISVYIGPSPKEREKEERKDRWEKKSPNNPHPHILQAQ